MKKDYKIIIAIIILCFISLSALFINNMEYFVKQCIWFVLGFIILFMSNYLDSKKLFGWSKYLYCFNLLLLGLVLIVGKDINGSKAWFSFKYFSFQPSELMKLSLALYLNNIFKYKNKKYLIKSFIIFLVPSFLVFIEPDTGAVLMYLIIYLSMFYYSLPNKKIINIILFILGILVVTLFILIKHKIIYIDYLSYRLDRIINIDNNYQINNALIAFGSSSFIGRKLANIYIPEALTDFMFVKVSSDLGLLFSFVIIICYYYIFLRLLKHRNNNPLFVMAFFWVFFFQVSQNILMNLGVVPIMGIPLPFLSYGGTNTIIYFLFISIILSTKKRSVI